MSINHLIKNETSIPEGRFDLDVKNVECTQCTIKHNGPSLSVEQEDGTPVLTVDTSTSPPLVQITGNMNVNGTLTYNTIQILQTVDPIIELALNNLSNNVDIGFFGQYAIPPSVTPIYTGFFRNHTDGKWVLCDQMATAPTTVFPITYVLADLVCGNLTGTLVTSAQPNITSLSGLTSIQGQTLSSSVWQYVAAMNQDVKTGSNPTFGTITGSLNGNATSSTTAATVTGTTQSAITTLPSLTSIQSQTLSSSVWQYVAAMDQDVKTGSNPTFGTVTGSLNGNANSATVATTASTAAAVTGSTQSAITTLPSLTSIQGQTLSSSVWPFVSYLNQDLKINSSPTFDIITGSLNGNASTASTAVAVSGSTQNAITSIPNLTTVGTIGSGVWQGSAIGGSYINFNATNLRVLSSALNTIQDIDTSANTQFNSLTLQPVSGAASGTRLTIRSGGLLNFTTLALGRTADDCMLGVAGGPDFFPSSASAGDTCLRATSPGRLLIGTTGSNFAAMTVATDNSVTFDTNVRVYGFTTLQGSTAGSGNRMTIRSGGINNFVSTTIGRTADDALFAVAGGTTGAPSGHYFTGSLGGDLCIRSENTGNIMMGFSNSLTPTWTISTSSNTSNVPININTNNSRPMIISGNNQLELYIDFYRNVGDPTRSAYIGHVDLSSFTVYSTTALKFSSATTNYQFFNLPSAGVTNIGVDGSGRVYRNSSSQRYKKNIQVSQIESEKIYQLTARDYEWKSTDEPDFGYVAEEVNEILPEAVIKNQDKECESVKYANMIVLVIEEMKKLRNRVQELERQLIERNKQQ